MIINALNSGAQVFMADFEDANSPTLANLVSGQANLMDAARRTITYVNPDTGKQYALNAKTATLMVRPRGLHLVEKHFLVDGRPAPAMPDRVVETAARVLSVFEILAEHRLRGIDAAVDDGGEQSLVRRRRLRQRRVAAFPLQPAAARVDEGEIPTGRVLELE